MLESESMKSDIIRSRLALAPKSPGVYLFRGQSGEVIYVGKASDLRNRVRSYFGGKSGLSTKVLRLVEVAADIEYILAGSEQEALVLEADLIKRYRPQYNARLKDDKSFPFLEVDTDSEWPTVSVTRRRQDDGSVYFGPFASARSMRQTLRLIRKTFRLRVCTGPMPMNRERACLNMHIGLCPGPCVGAISREEYRRTVDGVILFLQGRHRDVLNSLMQEMKQAAARLDFEQAALLRDKMKAVELVTSRYGGVTALRGDQDILAVAQDEEDALVDIFSVRDGRALGRQTFPVEGSAGLLPSEVLRAFVLAYYSTATNVPPVLMLQHPVADARLIAGWLSERRGGPVRMVVPRRGVRKQLLDNAADGVARQLAGLRALGAQGAPPREAGLRELKDVLGLPTLPHRIEGFDISTIQGAASVGSMVVFVDGVATPSDYRRFKIREVAGQDDYAMLAEVLRRRFARLCTTGKSDSRRSSAWSSQPSLMLVDGGRGQLGAALTARAAFQDCHIPIISLAKEHEQVYVEGRAAPVDLEEYSPGLMILEAVRDEAHRFAVGYHRNLRGASVIKSVLDDVPGIGPRRKRAVLLAYGSVEALRLATAEDIARTCRIPVATAVLLQDRLKASGV